MRSVSSASEETLGVDEQTATGLAILASARLSHSRHTRESGCPGISETAPVR